MSDKLPTIELRDYVGSLMFGPKYFDYCLTPMTTPKGKYPYPRAIEELDAAMLFITHLMDKREIEAKIELLKNMKYDFSSRLISSDVFDFEREINDFERQLKILNSNEESGE